VHGTDCEGSWVLMDEHRTRLFARSDLVLVVGAGVTASLTGGAHAATWPGLLESGIAHAESATPGGDPKWGEAVRLLLKLADTEADPTAFVAAAQMIQQRLRTPPGTAYAKWLEASFRDLKVVNERLFEAFKAGRFPILTTNIDTLLTPFGEQAPGGGVTGDDLAGIIRGDIKAVGFLHGRWDLPDSVVLGSDDYSRLLNDEATEAVERAVVTAKTLVYVGFGKGLADPNFGQLLAWHRRVFGNATGDHYRLCRTSELRDLQVEHSADRIRPVAYGDSYDDLPAFLEELFARTADAPVTEAGVVRDSIAEAKAALEHDLIATSVLAETCNRDDITLHEAVVAPVLLPVPHSEWVRTSSSSAASEAIEPLDARDELQRHDVILLVGDEGSGLTTAAKWLALESARLLESAPPFYVDFRSCTPGARALHRQLTNHCLEYGFVSDRSAPLPELVVAVDNLRLGVKNISEMVLRDLAESHVITAIVTCRPGEEAALSQALAQAGREPVIRYLGRLGTREIATIAKTVSVSNHQQLASRVMTVVRAENLPRTPYSISLLMAVLEKTDALLQSYSQTAVLEQYVEMLLGRGDPHEDSRFSLDHKDRQTVLARLAHKMTVDNRVQLGDAEVIENFTETFAALGWSESAPDLLKWFERQRLLRRDRGHIAFSRMSYLYLFAAKYATDDGDFLANLLQSPLTYASVIADYAAIKRNDTKLLRELIPVLKVDAQDHGVVAGPADMVDVEDPTQLADDFVSDSESTSADAPGDPGVGDEGDSAEPEATEPSTGGSANGKRMSRNELKFQDETEEPAFDESWRDSHGTVSGSLRALDLASRVLRDSDQVTDQVVKVEVLGEVLLAWGRVVTDLSSDHDFNRLVDALARQLAGSEIEKQVEKHDDTVVDFLRRVLPSAFAWSGVRATLTSRKLVAPLKSVQSDAKDSPLQTQIGAILLEMAVRDSGWTHRVVELCKPLGPMWFVRRFVLPVLYDRYVRGSYPDGDGPALLELCGDLACSSRSFDSATSRSSYRSRFMQNLRDKELLHRTRMSQRAALRLPKEEEN